MGPVDNDPYGVQDLVDAWKEAERPKNIGVGHHPQHAGADPERMDAYAARRALDVLLRRYDGYDDGDQRSRLDRDFEWANSRPEEETRAAMDRALHKLEAEGSAKKNEDGTWQLTEVAALLAHRAMSGERDIGIHSFSSDHPGEFAQALDAHVVDGTRRWRSGR